MRSNIYTRTLLIVTVMLFSIVTSKGMENPSDLIVGKWTKPFNERSITFSIFSDSRFEVEFAGDEGIDVWGSYVISGTKITFNDEGGEYSSAVAGVYGFVVDETSLRLTEENDPVYGRKLLVEGSWTKSSNIKE